MNKLLTFEKIPEMVIPEASPDSVTKLDQPINIKVHKF